MIKFRWANKTDRRFIAEAMVAASGGICDYLLKDPQSRLTPVQLLAFEVARSESPFSYRHCVLAIVDDEPIALLCAYAAHQFLLAGKERANQALASFYQISFPGQCLYVDTVYVSSSWRGHGISKLLLSQLVQFFHAEDYQSVALYVWQSNVAALNLYQKFGFKEQERKSSVSADFPVKEPRLLLTVSVADLETHLSQFKVAHGVRHECDFEGD